MLGIGWQFFMHPFWVTILFCVLGYMGAFVLYSKFTRAALQIVFLISSFFLGSFLLKNQYNLYAFTVEKIQKDPGRNLTLRVCDINQIDHPRFRYSLKCTIVSEKRDGLLREFEHSLNTIMIYARSHNNILVDDIIELENIALKTTKDPSLSRYFIKENILATHMTQKLVAKIRHSPQFSFPRALWDTRERIFTELQKSMSPRTFTYFSSIFLGYRKINKQDNELLKDQCRLWGVSHYLARSGLHLVVFCMVWDWLFKFLPLAFTLKHILLLLLTTTYCLLTWNSISFWRAFLMLMLYKICSVYNKPIHVVHIITLVTLVTLVQNPIQLFFLDFQLSFGITFLLAWINQISDFQRRTSWQNS
jgi:competence protein ComEC